FEEFSPRIALVPTVPVGMLFPTLCVISLSNPEETQSVEDGIPTQSVGTRNVYRFRFYLFRTSSRFMISLASMVQAARVGVSSLESGCDSPTVVSFLASSAWLR